MTHPYDTITIEHVAQFPRPEMNVPGAIRFTPDGRAVTFLWSEEGNLVRSLWRFDLETGDRSVLAGPNAAAQHEGQISREEELRRERARMRELGVTHYEWAKATNPSTLLIPMGGRLFVSLGDEPLRELEGTEGALDARLSADGRRVAFIRDGDLWMAETAGGAPRQLTSGAEDGLTNGVAEFIAQEELDRADGYWWSPDARRIAFVRADSRHIPKYSIVHQGTDRVDVEEHRYPFAGEPNAFVELGVIDLESGSTTWMDLGSERDIYLARAAWTPQGTLTAQVLSRDQKSLRLLAFEAESGAGQLLLERRSEPWLNLDNDTRFLESGELVRTTEKTGFRHLTLNHPEARGPRSLTSGDWTITRLVAVDEPARVAHFMATRESVLERHLYAVALDGGEPRRVTLEAGWHDAVLSPDRTRFIDTWSTLEHGPCVAVRSALTGAIEHVLHEPSGTSEALGLRPPELIEFPAEDGTPLFGAVYRPPVMEPGRRYPLVVSVYGGPHAQRVADDWLLTVDLRAQYLAQEGFIVLKLDNRGSANRGLAFEGHLDRNMGTIEVADQVSGVRHLVDRGEADPHRVGIYGWSYGGYMTIMSMLREPKVFRVGVAGAPVTDWDGYDTGYTERYMGTPQDNPAGYRESSALTHVDQLEGKLLLVHGMIDENVHFRHTARLITALSNAGKEYDLMLFPEERHMPRDLKGLIYQERRLVEYFKRHL